MNLAREYTRRGIHGKGDRKDGNKTGLNPGIPISKSLASRLLGRWAFILPIYTLQGIDLRFKVLNVSLRFYALRAGGPQTEITETPHPSPPQQSPRPGMRLLRGGSVPPLAMTNKMQNLRRSCIHTILRTIFWLPNGVFRCLERHAPDTATTMQGLQPSPRRRALFL